MKDEFKGKTTQELVGLKSKMYSLVNVDDEETIRESVKMLLEIYGIEKLLMFCLIKK